MSSSWIFWLAVAAIVASWVVAWVLLGRDNPDARHADNYGRHRPLPPPSRAPRTATPNLPALPAARLPIGSGSELTTGYGQGGQLNFDPSLAKPVAYYSGRTEGQRQLLWAEHPMPQPVSDDTVVDLLPVIREDLGASTVRAAVDYLFSGLEQTRWAGAA
jgi:hypothetical protein